MKLLQTIPLKYWLTGLILFLIYLANFRFDLVIDAGKYAAISKNIFESGDLIRLKVFDEPYDQKPPFMFWLAALSFKIFGLSNFSFKLPTFLFTLLGTFATFKLGDALYNKRTGIIAAIMLIASQSMLLYNNDTHTDVVLTMCIIVALWQLHKFICDRNRWSYLLGFIFVGFAVNTKGPIGMAVPVFALISHILITKNYKLLNPLIWIPGLLIISLIITPALVGLYQQFGADGLKFFFWTNNFGRITGTYTGNNNDYSFYLHTIGYLFLPFSLLTYFGAFQEIKNWVKNRFSLQKSLEGITMAIPIFIAILSVSKTKSPHYMLPVVPLIAIITAKWTDRIIQGDMFPQKLPKTMAVIQYIILTLLLIGSLLIPVIFFPTNNLSFWIPVILMIGITFYTGLRSTTNAEKLIHVPIMVILTVNLILTLQLFPQIFRYNATAIASRDYNQNGSEKSNLFLMNNFDYEVSFYAKNHPKVISDSTLVQLSYTEEPWVYTDSLGRIALLEEYPRSKTCKHYKYRRISKMGLKFLLPATRFNLLGDMYLIKVED